MERRNVLLSSAGRRVGLLGCIRDSVERRHSNSAVMTIDSGSSAPATFVGDATFRVPPCSEPGFIPAVLDVCQQQNVGLLIPTIDTELPFYASARQQLAEAGIAVCVGSVAAVEICSNKIATHAWLTGNAFPTVVQESAASVLQHPNGMQFPLVAKPYNGSASKGVKLIHTARDLEALVEAGNGYIVQEMAYGHEYTINVYVSRSGECVCAVPHWRMEVRSGEVSKGITTKDDCLMKLGRQVAEALPGAYGPLNIQCFMNERDIKIIEINARFGGGYPLAHRAGARFTDWLLDEADGHALSYRDDWIDDLAMLRYDEAIFVAGHSIRI